MDKLAEMTVTTIDGPRNTLLNKEFIKMAFARK